MFCCEPAKAASFVKASGRPNEYAQRTHQTLDPCLINGRSACIVSIESIKRKDFRRLSGLGEIHSKGSRQTEEKRERENQDGRESSKEIILKGGADADRQEGEGYSACG